MRASEVGSDMPAGFAVSLFCYIPLSSVSFLVGYLKTLSVTQLSFGAESFVFQVAIQKHKD
jgi:hypothetical protein